MPTVDGGLWVLNQLGLFSDKQNTQKATAGQNIYVALKGHEAAFLLTVMVLLIRCVIQADI